MKRFKVEGWYRLHDEKDFDTLETEAVNLEDALCKFLDFYCMLGYYKIDIKEMF
jgi:hypothetical protein